MYLTNLFAMHMLWLFLIIIFLCENTLLEFRIDKCLENNESVFESPELTSFFHYAFHFVILSKMVNCKKVNIQQDAKARKLPTSN